ncbi:hypothetical protein [Marinifilum breve]|uniref:hypothetical protein n=1 Tax=Marinifilum breve TaxID=2184082 RepID=UPI0010579B9E|nr:hypothetical protein [Marinifilum breve]
MLLHEGLINHKEDWTIHTLKDGYLLPTVDTSYTDGRCTLYRTVETPYTGGRNNAHLGERKAH